jgi:hypothetical protein
MPLPVLQVWPISSSLYQWVPLPVLHVSPISSSLPYEGTNLHNSKLPLHNSFNAPVSSMLSDLNSLHNTLYSPSQCAIISAKLSELFIPELQTSYNPKHCSRHKQRGSRHCASDSDRICYSSGTHEASPTETNTEKCPQPYASTTTVKATGTM